MIEDSVTRHPITVVSAPSGFGKTTAVAAWADATDREIVWLSIGVQAEDRARTDARLVAALEAHVDVPARLTPLAAASAPEGMARVLDAVARHPRPITVVVDDAHRAEDSLATGLLAALIDEPAPPVRLVLVGASQLDLLLPRFLLTHPQAHIGAETLAFDEEEVARLGREMSTTADIGSVRRETGGWPIAVRLALQTASRRRGGAYGGGLMHDYVRDVVLTALPCHLARFALEAATIDTLTPALAAELTGRPDAPGLLEESRRLGLFLERQDGPAGTTYRWFPLFARHCRDLLAERDPDRAAELRRRAAGILAVARPLDAVVLLLESGEPDAARELVMRSWTSLLVGDNVVDVLAALGAFPAEMRRDPSMLLIRACAAGFEGDHDRAHMLATEADEAVHGDDDGYERARELSRLILADDRPALGAAVAAVEARRASGQDAGPREAAAIAFLLGWTELRRLIDPVRAVASLEAAVRAARAAGDATITARAQECLGFALAWSGRLRQASAALAELTGTPGADAAWNAHIGGIAGVAAGIVAYWQLDLSAAERHFRTVFAFTRGRRVAADLARVMSACAAAATGDERLCRRAAFELQFLPRGEEQGVEWLQLRQIAAALLEEAIGQHERGLALARSLANEPLMPLTAVLVAGMLRRAGDHSAALQLLRKHSGFRDMSFLRVASLVTAATCAWDSGDADTAHRRCEEALMIAADEGIRIPFTDADPLLRDLLGAHLRWSTRHEEFVTTCLRLSRVSGLTALSQRERDVFEQLRTTLTTTEIAERLGVSVNTVKTHQQAIYRKLEVTSRREALRRYT